MAVKSHIALYGTSTTGKTNLLRTAALGYHKATGKKVRLVSAESAQRGPIEPAIRAGVIEPWWIDNATFPFERVRDAVQGAWPVDPDDPSSPVIPAFIYKYSGTCATCKTLVYQAEKAPPSVLLPCPKCKAAAPPVIIRPAREINKANGIQDVGMYLFEGGTAFGELFMDNMSDRSAKGEKMGEDVAVRFKDGALEIAGSSRSSYGIAQRRIKNACQEARHLPVDYDIWTFTKEVGTDDMSKQAVLGPKLPGSAATPDVPRWFGPLLGTTAVPIKKGTETVKEYRLYLTTYYETWNKAIEGLPNLCNDRIPANMREGVKDFYVVDPNDDALLWNIIKMIDERLGVAPAETKADVALVGGVK